jgi:hypothetical protein
MMRAALAALILLFAAGAAHAQSMILTIEINRSNPNPHAPKGSINTLKDMMAALAACWSPPPASSSRPPVDLAFQVSFKRSGELFGKPRAITFARAVTDEERQRYYTAVAEAVDRCSHMPFTDSMGGAVAGRTFRVNFLDRRNTRKAQTQWPTEKS